MTYRWYTRVTEWSGDPCWNILSEIVELPNLDVAFVKLHEIEQVSLIKHKKRSDAR